MMTPAFETHAPNASPGQDRLAGNDGNRCSECGAAPHPRAVLRGCQAAIQALATWASRAGAEHPGMARHH